MPRRLRLRRILKWSATLATILVVLGFAASAKWRDIHVVGNNWVAMLGGGSIGLIWEENVPRRPYGAGEFAIELAPARETLAEWWDDFRVFGLSPSYASSSGTSGGRVPLWIPLLGFALPTFVLWRLDRRRPLPGHCATCDYNLTANTSGRCPECGVAAEHRA